jgi:hypothetical protein
MSTQPDPAGSRRAESGRTASGTTADATPTLAAAILKLPAGPQLDELVGRVVLRLNQPAQARGVSTSWRGARQVVARLTALGFYLEMQVHADSCLCRVLRVLSVPALAQQLASAQAPRFPEAVAKAAAVACLEMEAHPDE